MQPCYEENLARYEAIKNEARAVIARFYKEHRGFPAPAQEEVSRLHDAYSARQYRFKYVVAKYFFNVTFEYKGTPWKYVIPLLSFYIGKKLSGDYKNTVQKYRKDFTMRLNAFSKKHPDVVFDKEAISQMVKLILACYITTFINLPLFSVQSRKKKLHDAYLAGFYYGLAYVISDRTLDDPSISPEQKKDFHEQILSGLSNSNKMLITDGLLSDLISMAREALPVETFENQYRLLFYLQCVQFDEYFYSINEGSDDEIIDKLTLSALKTHLSLFTIQSFSTNRTLEESIQEHIKYSLLVQLDDDLRDMDKDRKENITTFFSQPWTHQTFSPHGLYLSLVKDICQQNKKLSWLFSDYFKHLSKKEKDASFDQEKIALFVQKMIGVDPGNIINPTN
jgi:hypothetical protein